VTHIVLFSAANEPLGQIVHLVSSTADVKPLGQLVHSVERLEIDKKSKSRSWLLEIFRCFKFTKCPGEQSEIMLMLMLPPMNAIGLSPMLDAIKEISVEVLDLGHFTSTTANERSADI
jgi:hypothetical protein